jgi:hypothetical protein
VVFIEMTTDIDAQIIGSMAKGLGYAALQSNFQRSAEARVAWMLLAQAIDCVAE